MAGRFKLVAGRHVTWDPKSRPLTAEELAAGKKRLEHHYKVGDIVESEVDLVERYGPAKFERVRFVNHDSAGHAHSGPAQGSPTVGQIMKQAWTFDELNSMTVSDLRALASEEEIDLKWAKSKEDIIKVIMT